MLVMIFKLLKMKLSFSSCVMRAIYALLTVRNCLNSNPLVFIVFISSLLLSSLLQYHLFHLSPDQGGAIDYCIKNIKRGIRKRYSGQVSSEEGSGRKCSKTSEPTLPTTETQPSTSTSNQPLVSPPQSTSNQPSMSSPQSSSSTQLLMQSTSTASHHSKVDGKSTDDYHSEAITPYQSLRANISQIRIVITSQQ